MGESLGILRAVDGADAEGKKSSEDAGDGGVRTGRGTGSNLQSQTLIHELLVAGLWRSLRRHECGRSSAFETGCEAGLAVDDAANVAGAGAAKGLAASAAESDCGNIVMGGAVHTNLLYVVTDTTGRSGFNRSKTDGPSGALARIRWFPVWL